MSHLLLFCIKGCREDLSLMLVFFPTLVKYVHSNVCIFTLYVCSVGRRTKAPERGLRKKYHTPREAPELHELLEPLTLPPTKLEEKRTKIFRLIERKEKKRLANQYEETKKKVAALGHVDGQGKLIGGPELTDYEKNKLRQGKSNINFQLPTGASTIRGNPSATQRGTNDK